MSFVSQKKKENRIKSQERNWRHSKRAEEMKWTQKPKSKWFNSDLYPYDTCPDYDSWPGDFLGGKLLIAYTTTGFTFFLCKSELNRVDWHNELYHKTDNLGLFSVWKMLVWDLDITHTSNDCVNLNVFAYQNGCIDGPGLIHVNPVNNDEIDQLEQFFKQRNMHVNNFKPQECQHACLCYSELLECELVTARHWSDFSNEDHLVLFHDYFNILGHIFGVMFLDHMFVLDTNCQNKMVKRVIHLAFFKTRWKCMSNLFFVFDYWTDTPHIILNTFEKRAMDVEL